MIERMSSLSRWRVVGLISCVALGIAVPTAVPVSAQEVVQPLADSSDPEVIARAASQRQLTEALGFIAADGSNWFALSQAGRAALALGDARAALGFLARAEALAPRDPVIKAALGAAMVQLEDPQAAMRYFEAAIAAGGLDRSYLGDRGLAFDLLGDQRRAQADYVVAAQSAPSAELTRRHAISLGISGQADAAIQMLAPLLRAQDRAAWRSRAMIVAMNGRPDEARQIARTTMPPQLSEALDPYFALMDRLTPDQLAAASHFGRFPTYDSLRAQPSRANAARIAAASVAAQPAPASRNRERTSRAQERRNGRNRRAAAAASGAPAQVAAAAARVPAPMPTPVLAPSLPTRATAVASAAPPPAAAPAPIVAVASPVVESVRQPVVQPLPTAVAAAGPPDVGPRAVAPVAQIASAAALTPPASVEQPVAVAAAVTPAPSPAGAAAVPQVPTTILAGWSLDSVISSIEVPDAERSASASALSLAELETIAAEQRRLQQVAAEERAAARAAARAEARTRAQSEAETRRRAEAEEAARLAEIARRSPARFWVQVATGADVSALAFDCRRLTRQYAASFRGQSCATAVWGRTRRLVVGPFRTMAAAREWETAYKRAGGDGFAWASDAGEEVTPVGRGR